MQVTLRKKFENLMWKYGETFASYYSPKIIMGNRVSIASDEMIEYIIEGVPDT